MIKIQSPIKFLLNCSLLFVTWLLVIDTSVVAQTPSATDSAKQLRDSVAQKVAEEIAQIKKTITKKAYVGTISGKSDASITLTTAKNTTRSITVTPDTTIRLAGGSEGTLADLKTGQFIIAMGDVDNTNSLMTTKRLVIATPPSLDPRRAVFGTVSKVSSSSLTLTTNQNQTFTVKISSLVKFSPKGTKLSTIETGNQLVTVGSSTSDSSLTAKLIHLVQSQ